VKNRENEKEEYEGKNKTHRGEKPPSQQVSVFRMRFSVLSDGIIKHVKEQKGFKTYAFTANWIVEQYLQVDLWREIHLKEARDFLEKHGLRKEEL